MPLPPIRCATLSHSNFASIPLTQDKIRWGYRTLERRTKKGRNIRLVYVRNDIWEQWLDYIGICQPDLRIPAGSPDPPLSDKTIIFTNDKPQMPPLRPSRTRTDISRRRSRRSSPLTN